MRTLYTVLVAALAATAPALASSIDLGEAVVVAPADLTGPEEKAVQMLVEEVEKRSTVRWERTSAWPAGEGPVIAVTTVDRTAALGAPSPPARATEGERPAEGYWIHTRTGDPTEVWVIGNDSRGLLFGVGYLLRKLEISRDRVVAPGELEITTAPHYTLRGHQTSFRPKVNSYDGWTVDMWEQYFRDLAVFGANSYELIPPRSDDADDSPHFPLSKIDMMEEMSRLLDEYGLDVWIWYPAMDEDYSDPATVEFALEEWGEVFRRLPRVDHILVPGGDPGHTQPKYLMPLLEKQAAQLREIHPGAGLWVSPQGFSSDWLDEFFEILAEEPEWLTGLVYGPHIRISLPELAERAPDRYPIRRYPDITHSMQSQYPVPDWDLAYPMTQSREPINPRPTQQAVIFQHYRDYAMGVLTYSEGCNDDVNKAVWSGLSWDPDEPVLEILRDYARYYVGPDYTDTLAQGLLGLERNWVGPLRTNDGVYTTLQAFQQMESEAPPQVLLNWRFQMALYRAYYDAFVRSRLLYETGLEELAMTHLRAAKQVGSLAAMDRAMESLDRTLWEPVSPDWRTRLFQLAEGLFQSIRMQLSVELYRATQTIRGGNLDNVDVPLNNRLWLQQQFEEIRGLADEDERRQRIQTLVSWTNPGPGGYYDDLGNLTGQPHLVPGPGFEKDPDFLRSALVGALDPSLPFRFYHRFPEEDRRRQLRTSWKTHAMSLNDEPLKLRYRGLDPDAGYRVRITYIGPYPPEGTPGTDLVTPPVRLVADGEHEVHPFRDRTFPIGPVEFDVPRAATADGELELACQPKLGVGGFERGCRISEVWLIRKSSGE